MFYLRRHARVLRLASWATSIIILVAAFATVIRNNENTANETKRLAKSIQENRVQSALRTCEDQNSRNEATISYLKKITREVVAKHQLTKTAAAESLAYDIALIDALAPHQDCLAVAAKVRIG